MSPFKQNMQQIILRLGSDPYVIKSKDPLDRSIGVFLDHINKYDWGFISSHFDLSPEFLFYFQDRLDWNMLSEHCKMKWNTILQHADKVSWLKILIYQDDPYDVLGVKLKKMFCWREAIVEIKNPLMRVVDFVKGKLR